MLSYSKLINMLSGSLMYEQVLEFFLRSAFGDSP